MKVKYVNLGSNPRLARAVSRATKFWSTKPGGKILYFANLPIFFSSHSSRTFSPTETNMLVFKASIFSIKITILVVSGLKYPESKWP